MQYPQNCAVIHSARRLWPPRYYHHSRTADRTASHSLRVVLCTYQPFSTNLTSFLLAWPPLSAAPAIKCTALTYHMRQFQAYEFLSVHADGGVSADRNLWCSVLTVLVLLSFSRRKWKCWFFSALQVNSMTIYSKPCIERPNTLKLPKNYLSSVMLELRYSVQVVWVGTSIYQVEQAVWCDQNNRCGP